MFTPGVVQMVVVGLVALLLFGKRLPDAMRSLGGSFGAFKEGLKEDEKLLS